MNILYVILGVLVLLAIERWIYKRYWPKGVNASVRFSQDRAVEGDEVELIETVEYTGRLPLPWLRVKFQISRDISLPGGKGTIVTDNYSREDVFSIRRMQKITRRLPAVCGKRGQHRIVGVDAVSSDMFMTCKTITSFQGNHGITVYPCRTAVPDIEQAARQMMGEHITNTSRMEDPFMFRGVREYMPGDQMSHINWRATARTGKMTVNQFDHTSDLCVSIWLCFEENADWRDYELSEECIRIAATLIGNFIDDGIPVALCCNARDYVAGGAAIIGHGCSQEHKDSCLTALARLDMNKSAEPLDDFLETIPRSVSEDELVIMISPEVEPRRCERVNELTVGRDLLWIVPVNADDEEPELNGLETIRNNCVWRVRL
ncbi:MAG: DUF58 domain-containing protein [Ruminococcaceae bacterium]|nr:DUF58 domain-containing protein [Oscillospiraceae bacterium]